MPVLCPDPALELGKAAVSQFGDGLCRGLLGGSRAGKSRDGGRGRHGDEFHDVPQNLRAGKPVNGSLVQVPWLQPELDGELVMAL